MLRELLRETEGRMQKAVESLEKGFRSVRTGRATPALVEGVLVDYYGAATPLQQLAVISAPEPHLILIRPYDAGSLITLEKGILAANLGLTPHNDGRVIRIPIPRLTEERRRELTKVVNRRVEESKVALRNIRRDSLADMREFESEKLITEDELAQGKDKLQDLIDRLIEKTAVVAERKKREIMEV